MRKTLTIVALLAVVTGGLYFWRFDDHFSPDSPSYIAPAGHLLNGEGYVGSDFYIANVKVDDNHAPELLRPPGYPLFLSLFIWAPAGLTLAVIVQLLIRAAIIVSAAWLCYRVTRRSRAALLTGIAASFDFPFLEASNSILSDVLFAAFCILVYWLLLEGDKWKPAIAGLISGATVLIRPIGLYFFIPAILFIMITKRRDGLRPAILFFLCFAALPSVWAFRNYEQTGFLTVSTINGFSALDFKAAGAIAAERPGNYQANVIDAQRELNIQACPSDCDSLSSAERSKRFGVLARATIPKHPIGFIRSSFHGFGIMMLDGGPTTLSGLLGTSWPVGRRILAIYTVPVFLFSVAGLVSLCKANRKFFWLAGLAITYFVALSVGPEVSGRFRLPFLPLYAIAVGFGLDIVLDHIIGSTRREKSSPELAAYP
jgi:4-amino-4-deoxy-L-arabinose transferase-like glycosyltransferase